MSALRLRQTEWNTEMVGLLQLFNSSVLCTTHLCLRLGQGWAEKERKPRWPQAGGLDGRAQDPARRALQTAPSGESRSWTDHSGGQSGLGERRTQRVDSSQNRRQNGSNSANNCSAALLFSYGLERCSVSWLTVFKPEVPKTRNPIM